MIGRTNEGIPESFGECANKSIQYEHLNTSYGFHCLLSAHSYGSFIHLECFVCVCVCMFQWLPCKQDLVSILPSQLEYRFSFLIVKFDKYRFFFVFLHRPKQQPKKNTFYFKISGSCGVLCESALALTLAPVCAHTPDGHYRMWTCKITCCFYAVCGLFRKKSVIFF